MAKKAPKNAKDKIVEAALALAAGQGWRKTTLSGIAKKAGLKLADLKDHFEDKNEILAHFSRMIDREVLRRASAPDRHAPETERIFDVLMERFDVLNEYRNGLVPILEELYREPKAALISFGHLCGSMNWMLEAAGGHAAGVTGALKITALTGAYIYGLKAWLEDESADLAKTMAALDKGLTFIKRFSGD